MPDVLDLPFDQYQRYALVRALLESVRAPGETFEVLDVGGRTALLRDFLPDDRVQLVDVDPAAVPGLVLGSGAQLPFRDDSVDVVAAFDTLEHVPPPLRDAFVAECARVARRHVILAGPYHTDRVAEAEEILMAFLKERLRWEHRYLAEHRTNGLPDAAGTRAVLEAAGARVEVHGHGALDRWLLLMCLELYVEHEPLLRQLAKRAYRLYNEHLFRSDHGPEVYRHAVVATFGDAPAPHLRDALDPSGVAPAGATDVFRGLGQELLRYDALRDSFEPEMERLHGVVRDLEKDLAEHRASLTTVEADLAEHRASLATVGADLTETRKTVATLEADLHESRRTIEALRAELERERREVGAVLAERDEAIGGLRADLDGHRATLAEVQRLRQAELDELELRGGLLEEANSRLTRLDDELRKAHDRLHAALERASETEQALEDTEQVARRGIAAALAEAETVEERRAILDARELTLDEELGLIVDLRDRRLRERDEARARLRTLEGSRWVRVGRMLRLAPAEPHH